MASVTRTRRGNTAIFRCEKNVLAMSPELFRRIRFSVPLLLIAGLAAIFSRIWWAGATPSKPEWLPESSVWVSGPHTPLEMDRVGEWVGCTPRSEKVAECWFTDYKGSVTFQGQFARLDRRPIGLFQIQQGDMSNFRSVARKHGEVIRIVRLEEGGIMAPISNVSNLDALGHPKS